MTKDQQELGTNKSRGDTEFREGMNETLGAFCIQIQGCRQNWGLELVQKAPWQHPARAGGLCGDPKAGAGGLQAPARPL